MRLVLLRHAAAEDRGPDGADDPERRLTKKGLKQISGLSSLLRSAHFKKPARLLSSPYRRCLETAQGLRDSLGWKLQVEEDPRLIPEASVTALLSLLAENARLDDLWLVGHEPDLSTLAGALSSGLPLELRKCGLIEMELESIEPPCGQILSLLRPGFFPKG